VRFFCSSGFYLPHFKPGLGWFGRLRFGDSCYFDEDCVGRAVCK